MQRKTNREALQKIPISRKRFNEKLFLFRDIIVLFLFPGLRKLPRPSCSSVREQKFGSARFAASPYMSQVTQRMSQKIRFIPQLCMIKTLLNGIGIIFEKKLAKIFRDCDQKGMLVNRILPPIKQKRDIYLRFLKVL